ncbi:hypothetical protein B5E65_10460 [Gemmiger sp. An120]|nr:hypothetical protein B5E65_10460 [Gemmiger sp. An120]
MNCRDSIAYFWSKHLIGFFINSWSKVNNSSFALTTMFDKFMNTLINNSEQSLIINSCKLYTIPIIYMNGVCYSAPALSIIDPTAR